VRAADHLAVSTHDQGGTWLLEATLTPIDSTHTRLRFVHHLDEDAESQEVGPAGSTTSLVFDERKESTTPRSSSSSHRPWGPRGLTLVRDQDPHGEVDQKA
jgi:hypothetical protein